MLNKIDILKKICTDAPSAQAFYLLASAQVEAGNIREARDAIAQALALADQEWLPKLMDLVSQIALQESEGSLQTAVMNGKDPEDAEDVCVEMDAADDAPGAAQAQQGLTVIHGGREDRNKVESLEAYRRQKKITFADVGGLDDVKAVISMRIIQPFLRPDLFGKFGKRAGGGVLLFGPPGCGKTYIAKATAGECSAQFINVSITDILDKYIGESEHNMENLFIRARIQKPSVVFMDEIDMLGFSRIKTSSNLRGVVEQLLSEMDGTESNNDGILVIGATNMPWDVDTALKRPGRFDRTIFVPPPDAETRAMIFRMHLEDKPVDEIDVKVLSRQTEFFSGADIMGVVDQATEAVLEDIMSTGRDRLIRQKDLLSAVNRTKPSTKEWLKTISDYVRYSNQAGQYDDVQEFLKQYKGFI